MSGTDLNSVIIVGRLVRDPELKLTQAGKSLCNFSIAVNQTYTQDGEKKEKAHFFNCVVWGSLAEVAAEYCKKGHRVGVIGPLQQESWTDKDGKKQSAVKIKVEQLQFLQGKTESTKAVDPMDVPLFDKTQEGAPSFDEAYSSEEIPF